MKKLTPLIFGAVILIFLLTLVFAQVIWRIQDEQIFSSCSDLDGGVLERCLSDVFANMTFEDCRDINNFGLRSDCYLAFSKGSLDLGICDNVDEGDKAQCLINVYTNLAVSKNDSTFCINLAASLRFSCVTSVALISRDKALCELVKQESLKYKCQEYVVMQIAIDSNDIYICNEFEFQGNKYIESWVPRTRCIEQAAFCNLNKDLCETSDCVEKVNEYKVNDKSLICDLRQIV